MGRIKELKPFARIYIILIAVFFLSMTLVYCIPASWIQDNIDKSLEVMETEGERPMYAFYRHNAIVDNHTDMVMYEYLIPNRDYNPIQASVSINQYPRYWHGYQVLLRPLTIVFQVQELRYFGMLLFYLLFFWSAYLVAKRTKLLHAMLYVLTIASAYLVAVTTCFQYLTTFYVLFGAMIVLLTRYDKDKPMGLMLYFFVVGMIENFFDFLTYPIITLGIPLILLLWIRVRDNDQVDFKNNFWFMLKASVSWGFGYALTWMAKWGITVVVLGVRYFWRTMSVVSYRLNGSEEEPLDRLGTIRRNLKAWMNVQDGGIVTWSKVAALLLLIAVILVLWKKLKDKKTVLAYVPMLFVAAYPYIWYLVLSNHSQIHYWYTYRAQLVALFGILMFVVSILREKDKVNETEN